MKTFFAALLILSFPGAASAQITIDSTRATFIVRERVQAVTKTLSIYRKFVPEKGVTHEVIYQPDNAEYGDEPATLNLNFASESLHLKKMLDAAVGKRAFNFSRLAINILPYNDLVTKLINTYASSKEWNDYLHAAGDLTHTTTLFDGSDVKEIVFDTAIAMAVLKKSDLIKDFNSVFAPYGYKVAFEPFPEEHQQLISADHLKLLGKKEELVIPVPSGLSFSKIK
jgi:hypothetical protein